jgi:RNA 2',3'-cyclic 3'-phosphodiesterase
VTGAASVGGRERSRLFAALVLPDDTVRRLVDWQAAALAAARDVRAVGAANLHITAAFLGPRPASELESILGQLREAAASAERPELSATGYRETRSVGMVVLDDLGGRATAFAEDLQRRLEAIGVYAPERRRWLAHITVVRFRRPPRLTLEPPDLGQVSPSEAAVYHSVLRPTGAQYEILESVSLGRKEH